jgi:hypothetical protein
LTVRRASRLLVVKACEEPNKCVKRYISRLILWLTGNLGGGPMMR